MPPLVFPQSSLGRQLRPVVVLAVAMQSWFRREDARTGGVYLPKR